METDHRHALVMMWQLHTADIAPSTDLKTERLRALVLGQSPSLSPGATMWPDVSEG